MADTEGDAFNDIGVLADGDQGLVWRNSAAYNFYLNQLYKKDAAGNFTGNAPILDTINAVWPTVRLRKSGVGFWDMGVGLGGAGGNSWCVSVNGGPSLFEINTNGETRLAGNKFYIGPVGQVANGGIAIGGWSGNASIAFQNVAGFVNTLSTYATSTSGSAILGRVDNVGAAFASWWFNGNGIGSISTNGTSVSYNTTSDERLKKNIVDATDDPGAIIDQIQVRAFDWRTDDTHVPFGFIAQELVNVAPGAVTPGDDKPINDDGTVPPAEPPPDPDNPDAPPTPDPATEIAYWGVDPAKLVPMLVLEIQHLRARITTLETPAT